MHGRFSVFMGCLVLPLLLPGCLPTAGPQAEEPARAPAAAEARTPEPRHPLDPLSADELKLAVETLRQAQQLPEHTLFATVVLNEPPKEVMLRYQPGVTVPREAFAVVYDHIANQTYEAIVDLAARAVRRFDRIPSVQPMMMAQEFEVVPALVQNDPRVREALKKRGITDADRVQVDIWAPGHIAVEGQPAGARFCRCIFYYQGTGTLGYGRPIEGLVAVVNLNKRAVVHVVDTGVVPLARQSHDFFDPKEVGPLREGPRPLRTTQPEGASFTVRGHEVRWQKWRFRFANHQREGLVLYQVGYEDQGRLRSILYRGSLSEMVVPYGDPDETWSWRAAFDQGEYGLGQLANPLERGKDVPEHALLLDTPLVGETGADATIQASIALYERDGGLLWKHFDDYATQKAEVRRARELVIGQVVTVGNYDYGLSWVFTQDGQIKVEVELTGILLARGVRTPTCERCRALAEAAGGPVEARGEDRYGTLVAPQIVAPNHQHFFNFRLDLDVDGPRNTVSEMNVRAAPRDPAQPAAVSRNAFLMEDTVLATEQQAQRDLNEASHRRWKVFNKQARTALGHLPGYTLEPGENAPPYLAADAPVRLKAQFVNHHFWATRYQPREVHAAGSYPNQGPGGEGLPRYVSNNEALINEDLVVWYTFGLTHVARPEEWPVMPATRAGFRLVPRGFFSRNPALDVPAAPVKQP